MAKPTTIRLAPAVRDALELDSRGIESLTGRLGFMVESAHHIIMSATPELTRNEWLALIESSNGSVHNYEVGAKYVVNSVLFGLSESARELDNKFGVDCAGLARRIAEMPWHAQFAVTQVARRFWLGGHDDMADYDAILLKIGARCTK